MKTTKSKAATTKKMSKDEAVKFLSATLVDVAKTDDGLAKRVDYALTHKTKATVSDLTDLVDEVKDTLTAATTTTEPKNDPEDEPAPETVSTEDDPEFDEPKQEKPKPVKPTSKASKKSEQKSTKKPVVEKSEKPAVKQENNTTKTGGGKTTIKKSDKKPQENKSEEQSVQTAPTLGNTLSTAKVFPTTIKDGSGSEWQSAPFNFQNMDELLAYIQGEPDENGEYNNPRAVVFAAYWTEAMIQKYNYAGAFQIWDKKLVPKKFQYDLDVLELVLTCDHIKRVWCKSMTTDAMMFFEDTDIAPIKEKNPVTGDEYLIRVANGMEYEIYVDPAEFLDYIKKSVKS